MEPTTEEKYAYARKKFKRIELLYNLTIGLPLVVFGIFFLNYDYNEMLSYEPLNRFQGWVTVALALVSVGALILAYQKNRKTIRSLHKEDPFTYKIDLYTQNMQRMHLTEGVAAVGFLMGLIFMKHMIFVIGYAVMLLLLTTKRPTAKAMVNKVPFEPEEKRLLNEIHRHLT